MIKLSELISKQVISVYECQNIGTISGACFNKTFTKIVGYTIFDDESEFDNFVPTSKIYSLTQDGILIRNTTKIEPNCENINSPINKRVFTLSGNDLGKICDCIIDDRSNTLYLYTNKDNKIDVKNIINVGNDIILLKQNDDKISINSFKPKETFDTLFDTQTKVKIVPIINYESKQTFPTKIIANTSNILGKRAKYTLVGKNNEIIVKENQLINEYIINMAKKHNKINDLVYSAT